MVLAVVRAGFLFSVFVVGIAVKDVVLALMCLGIVVD